MSIQINRTTNANCWLDGNNLLGKVAEAEAPTLKPKFADVEVLGLFGSTELPSGFDKMDCKLKFNAIYADMVAKCADPFVMHELQIRGNIETYSSMGRGAQVPSVIFIRGQFKNSGLGNFKPHTNVDIMSEMNVIAVRHEINGVTVLNVDVYANVYEVAGADILGKYRQNIGG